MSLKKINDEDVQTLLELIKLSREELIKRLLEDFVNYYGRYENSSSTMYFNIYRDDANPNNVVWQSGFTDEDSPTETKTYEQIDAFHLLADKRKRGFTQVVAAQTESDLSTKLSDYMATLSEARRSGLLGRYTNRKNFVRINEFSANDFTVERGYDNMIGKLAHATLPDVKILIEELLASGYTKESFNSNA